MARIELQAEKREIGARSIIRGMRRTGVVPAVVYHKGEESLPIQLPLKALDSVLHTSAGRNVLIDLKVKNEKAKQRTVVVKDLQHDPVSGLVLHVDFHQISLTEKIKVNVPVHEKGEAPGVKNDGGILETMLREIEVECLPTDIPEHIEIDVSALKLNDSVHVRDLSFSPNVKVLSDPDMVILQVKLPTVEEVAPAGAEGEEAKEPEVITEKKKEEGAEGAAAPAADAKKEKGGEKEAGKK